MDPSGEFASAGEFSGSESGWTTYIGSPIHNGNYDDDEVQSVDMEECYNKYKNVHDDDDKGENNDGDSDYEESDDSLVSDASSGPSHLQLGCINSEGSHHHHGVDFKKHVEYDNEKILSAKRKTKEARKTKHEGMVERKDYSLVAANSAASHA